MLNNIPRRLHWSGPYIGCLQCMPVVVSQRKKLLFPLVLVLSYYEENRILVIIHERWEGLFNELMLHAKICFHGTGIDFKTSFMQAIGGIFYLFQLEDASVIQREGAGKDAKDQMFTAIINVHLIIKSLFRKTTEVKKRDLGHY